MRQLYALIQKENLIFFSGWGLLLLGASYIVLSMFLNFFIGGFFVLDNKNLYSYFSFQNVVFILIIPAITMRSWAEERKFGTIEFLLTQPISLAKLVMAKYLSCCSSVAFLLFLSFPLWIYCNVYYQTDNLNIISSYIGCFLMGAAFCAIGSAISAICTSSAIAYISTSTILFILSFMDFSKILYNLKLQQATYSRLQNSLNLDYHFYDFITGQISFDNFAYFILLSCLGIWLTIRILEYKKG